MSVAKPVVDRSVSSVAYSMFGAFGPTLDLDFTAMCALNPIITFTRSSVAWYWGADGLLKKAAVDEWRKNHDPATGECLGILIEKQRTNSLLNNRDLSAGDWVKDTDLAINQSAVGLDGQSNKAWTVEDTNASAAKLEQIFSIADDSNPHILSCPVKKDSNESRFPLLYIDFNGGTSLIESIRINTKTGAYSERDTDGSVEVVDLGDYWKFIFHLTNNGTGNTNFKFHTYPGWSDTFDSDGVNVVGSIVYDFGQGELNASFSTSPIETGASAVTRDSDNVEILDLSWLNETEGSFYFEAFSSVPGTTTPVFDNDNDRHLFRLPAEYSIVCDTSVIIKGGSLESNELGKLCGAYQKNNFALALNGSMIGTNDAGNIPRKDYMTKVLIGYDQGNYKLNGHIKCIKYWSEHKSDNELKELTS